MLAFVNEAKAATTSVSNSNMEITKQNIETLTKGLQAIKTTLERMSTPIEGATGKLERTLENFSKQIDKIIGELQRDIAKQNENYGQHLDEGKKLREKIETLLPRYTTTTPRNQPIPMTLPNKSRHSTLQREVYHRHPVQKEVKYIADLDLIKYKTHGIFTGSRGQRPPAQLGTGPLAGGSKGGRSRPFLSCIAQNRNVL